MADGDPGNPGNPNQGAFTVDDNFINTLPDDLKAEPSIQPFKGKGAADILRSYVNAQRMIGADKIVIPSGTLDTPAEWDKVYSRLGRPDNPDGYKFEAKIPDGTPGIDPNWDKGVRMLFHQAGLPNKQANQLYGVLVQGIIENQKRVQDAETAEFETASNTLKTDWGQKYDANLELANKVLLTYGGKPEEVTAFIEKFGTNPVAIRILANIGNLIGEGNFVKGDPPAFTNTPDQAKSKALDIMSNKENALFEPYHNKTHIRHKEAVEEVERLHAVAYGNQPVDKK